MSKKQDAYDLLSKIINQLYFDFDYEANDLYQAIEDYANNYLEDEPLDTQ